MMVFADSRLRSLPASGVTTLKGILGKLFVSGAVPNV
jgi:hypothetical protein